MSAWTESRGVVIDASALVGAITGEPAGRRVRDHLRSSEVLLHAPAVIDVEVLHALRRGVLGRKLDQAAAEAAIRVYVSLQIVRFAHDMLFFRIWELRHNFTAYDAAYVALAEGLNLPLVTSTPASRKPLRRRYA